MGEQGEGKTTYFPIARVRALRERAERARRLPESISEGWNRSRLDPMRLLSAFPALGLNEGYILRAYQYRSGGNGNGIVWAMPRDADFPAAEEFPRLEENFLQPPKPPSAIDDVMQVIDGDGSPWSYLEASLFAREVAEFGAMLHGVSWGAYKILGEDPWQGGPDGDLADIRRHPAAGPDEWEWRDDSPADWRPSVTRIANEWLVQFIIYTGLGGQRIALSKDRYGAEGYQFESEVSVVASGPGGYIH